MKMDILVVGFAIVLLIMFWPRTLRARQFVIARGTRLFYHGKPFFIRGVALMDDMTLWDSTKNIPAINAIEKDDYAFAAQGAINTIRLAVKADYFIDEHGKKRPSGFAFLDHQIHMARDHHVKLLIDMHVPVGGAVQDFCVTENNQHFWESNELQDRFVQCWRLIARTYKDEDVILGYELFNEAAVEPERYWVLIRRAAEVVRAVDRHHVIAVQADRTWQFQQLPVANVLCIYHFYEPLFFTHQNVSWNPIYKADEPIQYPGIAPDSAGQRSHWDAGKVQESIHAVRETSEKYKYPAIIGEFAVCTAIDDGSQRQWLTDVLDAIDKEELSGYIYWRQTLHSTDDITQKEHGNMAVRSTGGYFGKVQFEKVYRSSSSL